MMENLKNYSTTRSFLGVPDNWPATLSSLGVSVSIKKGEVTYRTGGGGVLIEKFLIRQRIHHSKTYLGEYLD